MGSQNLKNSYQVTVMSESENMNLKEEESQESHSTLSPESFSEEVEAEANVSLESDEEASYEVSDKEDHEPKKRDGKDVHQAQFDVFFHEFEKQVNLEDKLQLAIHFMEESLAQGGTPHFRNFWEARRICLPLFKENISPTVRGQLWNKYSELSKEARRLKDLLDEQSAFAIEQIEIAIKALEDDIEHFDEHVQRSSLPEGVEFPSVLEANSAFYEDLQKKLSVLNVQASRINALRKELLKTEMRVRQKNKFFQRLSLAGDKVFPQRKEYIKQISQTFITNIDEFIQTYFKDGDLHPNAPLYELREEIKALQGIAKLLTLNTNAFTQTRMRLSEAWDHIKIKEKERKKERAHQRASFRQNADEIREHINFFKEEFAKGTLSTFDANKKLEELSNFMRRTELDRDDIKRLRDEMNEARKPVHDKFKLEEDAKNHQEQERNRQKKEKFNTLKDRVEALISQHDAYNEEQIIAERDDILSQIQDSALAKIEKIELERLLKPLRDIITEKKEKALLTLSDDDRQALQQLQEILKQRKERRQEVKNQLETLRKAVGSSSLDFEKAIQFNTQINEEKERLEKMNQGIKEIESKIVQLQSQIRNKA